MGEGDISINDAAAAGQKDEEFAELVNFLADPRLEVQVMAAEGMLAYTEQPEFIDYCIRNPRQVGRQLLRLAERAEELCVAKKNVEQAIEMGKSALQALVNLSGDPKVADELCELGAVRRLAESLQRSLMEGFLLFLHWNAMVLANLSARESGQKQFCENKAMFRHITTMYLGGEKIPPCDGYDDPLQCLGKVICNVLCLKDGRSVVTAATPASEAKDEEAPLAGNGVVAAMVAQLENHERRQDVLGALRNLCFDESCHSLITTADPICMWRFAEFLYPWTGQDAFRRDALPDGLRKRLESKPPTLTDNGIVRHCASECIMALCGTQCGREYLRTTGCYEVVRAWHLDETDIETRVNIERIVDKIQLSEDELQDDARAAGGGYWQALGTVADD